MIKLLRSYFCTLELDPSVLAALFFIIRNVLNIVYVLI